MSRLLNKNALSGAAFLGGLSSVESSISHGLAVLPELSGATLHFVADDWVSGNWTARSSDAVVATLHGTITKTLVSALGRHGLTGWGNSNFFQFSAPNVHADDSWEILYVTPSAHTGFQQIIGSASHGSAGQLEAWNAWSGVDKFFWPQNNAGNNSAAGLSEADAILSKPLLLTGTVTTGSNNTLAYYNGTVSTGKSTLGTFQSNANVNYYIGTQNGGNSLPSDAIIIEIMRTPSIIAQSSMTTRYAQFNSMKGY